MKSPTPFNNVEHSCRPLQLISTSCRSGAKAFWKHLAITSHFLKAQGSRGPDLKCCTIHSILPGLNQTPCDHLTQIQSWCRLESFLLWYNTRSKGSGLINYPDFQYFGSIEKLPAATNYEAFRVEQVIHSRGTAILGGTRALPSMPRLPWLMIDKPFPGISPRVAIRTMSKMSFHPRTPQGTFHILRSAKKTLP